MGQSMAHATPSVGGKLGDVLAHATPAGRTERAIDPI